METHVRCGKVREKRMNPVFIAFCILTILVAIAFIATIIGIRYVKNEEDRDILCGSLIFWGGLFIFFYHCISM